MVVENAEKSADSICACLVIINSRGKDSYDIFDHKQDYE